MKTKGLSFLVLMVWAVVASAQTPKDVKYTFTEAADLTLIGRLFSDNPIPYHRVDTSRFHGFTSGENFQVPASHVSSARTPLLSPCRRSMAS